MTQVAVIGAGSSGLAVLRAMRDRGVPAQAFERGSAVGGMWRYANDNGMSSAYASLRTNVSRARMQYPGFPMPPDFADFPTHAEMTRYLESYAAAHDLSEMIKFRTTVERLLPDPDGGWRVHLSDGSAPRFRQVVIATGVFWQPRLPAYPGRFSGHTSHSHDYRTPERFTGQRVLVVGAGQSAAEIAVEVAGVAVGCFLSIRRGVHIIPRWINGSPYDTSDVAPLNRLPWGLLNLMFARAVARELGPLPPQWPSPRGRLLEDVPIISAHLAPAIRRGEIGVKPAVDRFCDDRVRFADGTEEPIDAIIYATGYRIDVPFVSSDLLGIQGRDFPLYRRIAPPGAPGLLFAGFVDAPGGLLPVVEAQAAWIAAVAAGALTLPPRGRAWWQAMRRAERRTRQRFPGDSPYSIRCDPHAYRRLLTADLRRAAFPISPGLPTRRDVGTTTADV